MDCTTHFFGLYAETHEGVTSTKASRSIRARERTARLSGKAKSTVSSIVTDWFQALKTNPEITAEDYFDSKGLSNRGRKTEHTTRIDKTENTLHIVRSFVLEKRSNREKVTSQDVLQMLIDNNLCTVTTDVSGLNDKNDFRAALRSVQRYLSKNSFQRGRRTGSIWINLDYLAWKDMYIIRIMNDRTKPEEEKLNEVYTDESYIHHHHQLLTYNLYHSDDQPDTKSHRKGKRFCFVSAIQFDPTSKKD